MSRFGSQTELLRQDSELLLWQRVSGRCLSLSPASLARLQTWRPDTPAPAHLAPLAQRLRGEGMLREAPLDPLILIPCPSRLVLLLPAEPALWLPIPAQRGSGGFPYRPYPLRPKELELWRAFNGARNLAAAARRAGISLQAACAFCAQLTRFDRQALQLRQRPPGPADPSLWRLHAPPRPGGHQPEEHASPQGGTDLRAYHRHGIQDAQHHFDQRETTLAHAFAAPHPALDGQPYGARLRQALAARDMLPQPEGVLLEIGPGSGELGAAWRAAGANPHLHLRLDLAPALLQLQARRQPGTWGLLADAAALPLRSESVDLVICNEVLADLQAVAPNAERSGALARRLARYDIHSPPERLCNLGAWRLLEQLARVLRPGGAAFLSEFGALHEEPTRTAQLDHPEVSLRFADLLAVARGLGLQAHLLPLHELLDFRLQERWLARGSFEALRSRLRAEGRQLQARAWTPASLALPWPVEGLHWVPITRDGPGPLVTRFQALLLRKASEG